MSAIGKKITVSLGQARGINKARRYRHALEQLDATIEKAHAVFEERMREISAEDDEPPAVSEPQPQQPAAEVH